MRELESSLEPHLNSSINKAVYRRYLWTIAMAMLLMFGVSGSVVANSDSYPDSAAINAMVMEIAESRFACVESSWSSIEGRPITALEIPCLSEEEEGDMVASAVLYAGEDGDEPANPEIVIETCKTITKALDMGDPVWEQALYQDGLVLYCVPLMNPDAYDAGRKKNLNPGYGSDCPEMPLNGRGFGVCIGRNQSPTRRISDECSATAPGPYPWSEPETAGFRRIIESLPGDYHRFVNLHSYGNEDYMPPYPLVVSPELENLCQGMARKANYNCRRISTTATGSLWYSLGDHQEMIVVETGDEKKPPHSYIQEVLYPRIEGSLLYSIRTADRPERVNGPYPESDTFKDNIVLTGGQGIMGSILFDDHVQVVKPQIAGVVLPDITVRGINPQVTIDSQDIGPFLNPITPKLLSLQGCRINWRTGFEECGDRIGVAWVKEPLPPTATVRPSATATVTSLPTETSSLTLTPAITDTPEPPKYDVYLPRIDR